VIIIIFVLLSIIIAYNYHRWPAMMVYPFWQPAIALNYVRISQLFH